MSELKHYPEILNLHLMRLTVDKAEQDFIVFLWNDFLLLKMGIRKK